MQADYRNEQHAKDIPMLLDAYATDPMGGGKPLDPRVKRDLSRTLAELPHAFSVLAYSDAQAVGLVNCFEAFSTFQCKPLVNVHDVVVLKGFRGLGISRKMLDKVDEIARSKGCCKVTLEVVSKNEVAKAAYRRFGFTDFELDPETGVALFWQKKL